MSTAERIAAWTPPPGFAGVESKLEGFEVFAPAPEADGQPRGPLAVRCRGCGASVAFDPARGALACSFCGQVEQERPEVVGREAAQGEFTGAALAAGAQGFGVDRRELGCGSCGATIALEAGALTATCPFCASNQVAVREHATTTGLRPTAVLPFAIDREECRRRASAWLGKGWLRPSDLTRLARLGSFVGIYVPYWTFSASLGARWEAEVGEVEEKRTYDRETGRWTTREVIHWKRRSGNRRLDVRDLLVPGTTKLPPRLLGRLEASFRLDSLAEYEPTLLAGFQAQTYDVPLQDAWEQGRHRMREEARRACLKDTGSSHVRNLRMTADLSDEAWRHVLLPVWVSAYRYRGAPHLALVDGSSGEVAGSRPVAWWKVGAAIVGLLSPAFLLGLLGLLLPPLLVLALVLLLGGGLGSFFVLQSALAEERT